MHSYTKYFKEQIGFKRFMEALYQKYLSLGKITGKISLERLTKEEAHVLSKLFGYNYQEATDFKISVLTFTKVMAASKYEDFDLNTLVEEYLGVKLVSKKETKEKEREEERAFYQNILDESKASKWLLNVIETKENPYSSLHKRYLKEKELLKKELVNVLALLNNLPKERTLISIYAANITMDPHYLDLDNNHCLLFFSGLAYFSHCSYPLTREDKIKLLSLNNIEIDNLSNFVITYNLHTNREYLNNFYQTKEPVILNIQNILNIDYIEGINQKIIIVENPSILNEIIARKMNVSVIVSGGFANTAVYLLLDKINNNQLFYNGDFDPEGLLIAQKLKEKYPNLQLFCYQKEDYEASFSKNEISNARINKLKGIKEKDLMVISNLIKTKKNVAYQENNKERIMEFIKKLYW